MRAARSTLLMVAGLIAILSLTLLVFGIPVSALRNIWDGAVGDKFGVARTLVKAAPLILCGLGIVVAWRAKMFNIGGEGQYLMGGVCGAWVAQLFSGLVPGLLNVTILIGSMVGGALFAGLAGWLHVKRGVQVVISTILLNFVAVQILSYAVKGPLQESQKRLPMTDRLPNDVMALRFDPQTDLHAGVLLAFMVAIVMGVYLFLTKSGFRLRLVGENEEAARIAGIDVPKTQLLSMLISGALCGLAGGVQYVGVVGQIDLTGFSQNFGFLAIPVAILGGLHPAGVAASGVFFGGLFAGSENLTRFTRGGDTVVLVMQAVAVLAYVGIKAWLDQRKIKREAF